MSPRLDERKLHMPSLQNIHIGRFKLISVLSMIKTSFLIICLPLISTYSIFDSSYTRRLFHILSMSMEDYMCLFLNDL